MNLGAAAALTAAVGGLIALQAPINSELGRNIGTFQAAFISFVTGTILLAVIAGVARGGYAQIADGIGGLRWYYLIGGLLGALYVTTVLVTVRTLGAGSVVAATIAGQLTAGVVIDHVGALGVEKDPISVAKIAGILLLAAGVYLIVRE